MLWWSIDSIRANHSLVCVIRHLGNLLLKTFSMYVLSPRKCQEWTVYMEIVTLLFAALTEQAMRHKSTKLGHSYFHRSSILLHRYKYT